MENFFFPDNEVYSRRPFFSDSIPFFPDSGTYSHHPFFPDTGASFFPDTGIAVPLRTTSISGRNLAVPLRTTSISRRNRLLSTNRISPTVTGRDQGTIPQSPSTTPTTSPGRLLSTNRISPTMTGRDRVTTPQSPSTMPTRVSPTTSTDRRTITQSPSTTQVTSIDLISPITSTPTRTPTTTTGRITLTTTGQQPPSRSRRLFVASWLGRICRESDRKITAEMTEIGYQISALKFCDNAKQRLWIGEMLMALLLRLDAVRGVREYRKKVVRRVIQLQEAVDSIAQGRSVETADSAEIYTGAIEENTTIEEAVEDGDEIACREINRESFGVGLSIEDSREKSLRMAEVTPSGRAEEWIAIKEAMERAAAEKEAMKRMVEELCERSQQQCDLLSSLVRRVEHLESRVQDMEQREKETKIY